MEEMAEMDEMEEREMREMSRRMPRKMMPGVILDPLLQQ